VSIFMRLAATAVAIAGLSATAQAATAQAGPQAGPPITKPRILVHLNLATGQQPENLALEPGGAAEVTFGFAGQVARIDRAGRVRVIAQVPVPDDGDVPATHNKIFIGGIVLGPNGTGYVAVSTGTAGGTGVYRLEPGRTPARIAALPKGGFLNGMALRGNRLYVADSVESTIWSVPLLGGRAKAWATGDPLAPHGGFGANGLKVHDNAVWVSNTQDGTLVRIPFTRSGAAGTARTVARGLGPIDDFTFTGQGRTVLAAINQDNKVILIRPDARPDTTTVTALTTADGVSNPTAVAVSGHTVYITDAAYFTMHDPNLIVAHLGR
jgi:sugar lactone lactonase YvrE